MKTYMIIEHFKPGKTQEIYARLAAKGRMMPSGLSYVDSWIEADLRKCYQVMRTDSQSKLNEWIDQWKDLMEFEVIPVLSSSEAREAAEILP